jgi:hypothetical protein
MTQELQPEPDRLPRWGLKRMFALVTAVAVVLAPFYWFGGLYLYSVICSLLLVYWCTRKYRKAQFSGSTSIVIVVFVFLLAGAFTLVFVSQAVLTAIVCVPLIALKVSSRNFAIVLAAVMVVVYGVAFWQGADASREMRALRSQYPFASLEGRLAFEREAQSESAPTINPPSLSDAVVRNLDEQDDDQHVSYFSRAAALHVIHDATYRDFARAAGFGSARMPFVGTSIADLSPAPEFTLPTPFATYHPLAATQELREAHRTAVNDFISPQRMGYIRSRNEVAGFESHRFTGLNERWKRDYDNARYWQVVRLELVGLLRGENPRVYVAKTIPKMEQLVNTPQRALNDFEKTALPQLRTQEDLVVNQQPSRIEMLGAVRAGKTCLECHHGDRGKLLGAFSYSLTPLPLAKPSAEKASAVN